MGAKNAKSSSALNKDDISKLHTLVKGKLSEDEIQACYKAYQEGRNSKKNDELNRDEFKKVYSALFQCESEELADHVFRSFDVNNDGHVNFQEFLLGLCLSGSSDAETKITWAFKVYDIDGDGTISWAEMRNIIQSVCNISSDSFIDQLEKNLHTQIDPSKSNQSNSEQLKNFGCNESNFYETHDRIAELADRLFLELDSDKDGTITLEEFRDGALKIPIVLTLLDSFMD